MKILEIIPQLSSGGAERFVVDLCNELSLNHEVVLVVFHSNNLFYKEEISNRVRTIILGKRWKYDYSLPIKLARLIKHESPDVVHTHLRAIVYSCLAILFYRNKYYFHTIHNTADKEASGRFSSLIRRLFFKKGLVVPITISEESDRSFKDYYGIQARMINNGRSIPNDLIVSDSVKNEVFTYKKHKDDRILVCLARYTNVKRQDVLTRVAAKLYCEGLHFIVLLIGREDEEVLSRVKEVNCPVVYTLGERHNPLEYLKSADAFCLCSLYEGLPISLIEALGVGNVPVCTPVGGIINLVKDGYNGFLSKDTTEEEYYYCLKRFMSLSDSNLKEMKMHAIDSYAPYSMNTCAYNYLQMFEQTVQK